MLNDLKERFLNVDTFIICPYLIFLGVVGVFSVKYFISTLSVGAICAGVWYGIANRVDRKRRGL